MKKLKKAKVSKKSLAMHPVPQKDDEMIVAPQGGANLTIEQLIATAIERGTPVATMERLLAMFGQVKAEKAKEAYVAAMAGFQSNCPQIIKTKEVKTKAGMVAYRYAPIESIVEQIKPLLEKYGFSFSNGMELLDSGVKVTVKVTHTAGHSEISEMTVPLGNKTDIMSASQVTAAAQTFAKRYAFCNAFGIMTADEDNDAKPADPANNNAALPVTPPAEPPANLVTEQQKKMVFALGAELKKEPEALKEWVKTAYKLDSFNDLKINQAKQVIDMLQKKIDAGNPLMNDDDSTPPPAGPDTPPAPAEGEDQSEPPLSESKEEVVTDTFKADVMEKITEFGLNEYQKARLMMKATNKVVNPDNDVDWMKLDAYLDMMAEDPQLKADIMATGRMASEGTNA